jgi:hypothetical protein
MAKSQTEKGEGKAPTFLEVYFSQRDLNLVTPEEEKTFVFDVESDGEKFLVGYSPVETFLYNYKIVRSVEDLEALFDEWLRKGFKYGYAFNIGYDLPVLLYGEYRVSYYHSIRNLGELFALPHYEVVRKKLFFEVKRIKDARRIIFYDLYQFYQTSLVNAYKAFENKVPVQFMLSREEEKEWLEDKEKRSSIHDVNSKETIIYNAMDVKVTAGLWHVAVENIRALGNGLDFGITLPMTAQYAITRDLNYVDYSMLDKADMAELYTALALSYRGGFFNSPQLGVMNKVYKYDVNSMYPGFMTALPMLKYEGRDRKESFDMFDLVCGQFSGNSAVPVKLHKQSIVLERFSGCVWGFELDPGMLKDFLEDYGVTPAPTEPYKPLRVEHVNTVFRFKYLKYFPLREPVLKFYHDRLKYKKEGNPYEKVLKILLNSSYGKYGELTFINPQRERVEFASLITAMGRVFINSLKSIGVVTYLTDSIVAHTPLPNSMIGEEIGYLKDETPTHDKFVNVNNGIYAFMSKGKVIDEYTHTRGFSKVVNGRHVAQEFFSKYISLVKQAKSPYEISILTYRQVMVKNRHVEELIRKYSEVLNNPDEAEMYLEQIQAGIIKPVEDRPLKGLLSALPVVVKGYNTKYVYSPFNGGLSMGSVLPDMFSAMVLRAFVSKANDKKPLWIKPAPLTPKANQVVIGKANLDEYKKKAPDAWNVFKILYLEDHELNRNFSVKEIEQFVINGKKAYALFEFPRKFILNLAYFQMVRLPYRLVKGKPGDGLYVFDVLPQLKASFASELINPETK